MGLLTRLLSLPFTLVALMLSRILRSRPYARLALNSGSGGDDGDETVVDPQAASEYFVRSLRTHDPTDDGTGVDSSLWYTASGYNAALRKAKEDCKILLVVLTSREHEDHPYFLRHTLCTPAFKQILQEHRESIMVWGGEVCISRDAHIASTILQATTYPFLAFLSLQPLPASRITGSQLSPSSSRMSVFSRLEGINQCSINSVNSHIQDTLLPRLSPFLGRLRAEKRERETERRLRAEQDRAYEEAGKRDLARVKAKEAELAAKKREEEERLQQERLKARESQNKQAWRSVKAKELSSLPEPDQASTEATRLVIRLSDGRRLVKRFGYSERAARIWEYVDCEAFGFSIPYTGSAAASPDSGYVHSLDFSLATTFPRNVLKLDASTKSKTVGDLVAEGLLDRQTANIIVEGLVVDKEAENGDTDEEEENEEDVYA